MELEGSSGFTECFELIVAEAVNPFTYEIEEFRTVPFANAAD